MLDRSEQQKKAILEILGVVVNVKTLTWIEKIKNPKILEDAVGSEEFTEVMRIYRLIPHHTWVNYKAMGVRFQAEQELLETAIKAFLFKLKYLVKYESKSNEPIEGDFDCNPFLHDE